MLWVFMYEPAATIIEIAEKKRTHHFVCVYLLGDTIK